MLGYYSSKEQEKEKVNNKTLKLLIQNLKNIVELLEDEIIVEDEQNNVIRLEDMMQNIQKEFEEPDYLEVD
jgi:transcriptional regulator with PAS, ATPase and Fis domain